MEQLEHPIATLRDASIKPAGRVLAPAATSEGKRSAAGAPLAHARPEMPRPSVDSHDLPFPMPVLMVAPPLHRPGQAAQLLQDTGAPSPSCGVTKVGAVWGFCIQEGKGWPSYTLCELRTPRKPQDWGEARLVSPRPRGSTLCRRWGRPEGRCEAGIVDWVLPSLGPAADWSGTRNPWPRPRRPSCQSSLYDGCFLGP